MVYAQICIGRARRLLNTNSDSKARILSLLILTPLIGALTLSLSNSAQLKNKTIFASGLWIATGEFILSLLLPIFYDKSENGYQFTEFHTWFDKFDVNYYLGVDGVSIPLILLTTFLVPICLLCSWNSIQNRVKEFVIYFLLLESFIIGVFVSIDLVIFYVFFEAVLIPMFLIIGIWGGENRLYATFKFFLYTLAGSVLMLLAIIYIISITNTGNIEIISKFIFDENIQLILFLCFFASFAVKVPMFPFHTWLPDAHVQAPAPGKITSGTRPKSEVKVDMKIGLIRFRVASITASFADKPSSRM